MKICANKTALTPKSFLIIISQQKSKIVNLSQVKHYAIEGAVQLARGKAPANIQVAWNLFTQNGFMNYSRVSNKRVAPNKRPGWKLSLKLINGRPGIVVENN